MRWSTDDVLEFHPSGGPSPKTVKRHYLKRRAEQGNPICCDNKECEFHTSPMSWNGEELKPILDHIDGCRVNNRASNLRLLCPNCDSQLPTRGGGNINLVEVSSGGYSVKDRSTGKRNHKMPIKPGKYELTFNPIEFVHNKKKTD